MKVLFVVPYPVGVAASQRVRVEQFLPYLAGKSITYKVAPFWDKRTWAILYKKGNLLLKALGTANGFLKRTILLTQLHKYNYIFVHREATPVGPPWFEWAAARIFRKKLIYDFDDAIWLENTSAENSAAAKYKQHTKTGKICAWSHKVCVGNSFLGAYAARYNNRVCLIPSTINAAQKYKSIKAQQTRRVAIGWVGSHSTVPYLAQLEPVLQQLEQHYAFDFVVIADRKPDLKIKSLKFIPWHAETEVASLLQLNIGVMPLPNTEWAQGKCAYKALQYMALGIPAVVSAVGANTEAVPHGVTGYTCTTQQEWYASLEKLLLNADLRTRIGAAGKAWVIEKYALEAHQHTFCQLFT